MHRCVHFLLIFQAMDGLVIYAGITSQYCMLNYNIEQFTDLSPIHVDTVLFYAIVPVGEK